MRALCVSNGKYTGIIDSVEMYEALRDGKVDFNPNVKSKIENITIKVINALPVENSIKKLI